MYRLLSDLLFTKNNLQVIKQGINSHGDSDFIKQLKNLKKLDKIPKAGNDKENSIQFLFNKMVDGQNITPTPTIKVHFSSEDSSKDSSEDSSKDLFHYILRNNIYKPIEQISFRGNEEEGPINFAKLYAQLKTKRDPTTTPAINMQQKNKRKK